MSDAERRRGEQRLQEAALAWLAYSEALADLRRAEQRWSTLQDAVLDDPYAVNRLPVVADVNSRDERVVLRRVSDAHGLEAWLVSPVFTFPEVEADG